MMELELEDDSPAASLIETIDRELARRGRDPLSAIFTGAINGVMGRIFVRQSPSPLPQRSSSPPSAQPRPAQPPRQPPPRPVPPPDPTIRAREILGFEPREPLTIEKVKTRKQQLARVFHPDMRGGSEAQMKRVNAAADALLAKLS